VNVELFSKFPLIKDIGVKNESGKRRRKASMLKRERRKGKSQQREGMRENNKEIRKYRNEIKKLSSNCVRKILLDHLRK
jgi:hypothetical protein